MKSYKTPFAIAGAVLVAAMLAVVNLITSPGALWCIYPIYAVIWWPLGVVLCSRKYYLAFALAGSLLTLVFLAVVNYIVTPGTLWFLYTVPLLLCFPAGVYLRNKMVSIPVAILFSVLLILYFTIINLLLTPNEFWAVYLIYAALWWPLSLYFKDQQKPFSVAGALLTIAFLIVVNLLNSPYPWALYASFPVIFWPIAMYAGKRLGGFRFSVIAAAVVIAYYGALNLLLEPLSPWVIFVAFAVLWWPLSVYHYGRYCPHRYAAVMSGLSIVFFAAVNAIYSPGALWAHYPAFAILWWPMTLMFARSKKWFAYSVAATLLSIVFFAVVNLTTSAGYPWSLFPSLGLLWWPLAAGFAGKHKPVAFAAAGAVLGIATLMTINLITSPGFLWGLFPSLGLLWWPLAAGFAGKHKPVAFSVAGTVLAIATLMTINVITSPGFLWSLFPLFALLWWPAAVACRKSALVFSITGSLLIIALVVIINVMTSPAFPWSVFVVFGVLWWPLSVGFHGMRKKRLAS